MVALLSSASAQAYFIETDWNNTGDTLATLDTETGIEWLDLTQTIGMSINQAENLTNSTFAGWRLPTRIEVTQMMANMFVSQSARVLNSENIVVENSDTNREAGQYRSLFGTTYSDPTYNYAWGLLKNDAGQPYSVINSAVTDKKSGTYVVLQPNKNAGTDYDFTHFAMSVFLVSDGGTTLSSQLDPSLNANNATNVPVTSMLGGLVLLMLGARRKVQK
jgi:uncharacterized protein (TIGR03382 family)